MGSQLMPISRWRAVAWAVVLAAISGCHVHQTDACFLWPGCFVADDYCRDCGPVGCALPVAVTCDDYDIKCLPAFCVLPAELTCDDYCRKAGPRCGCGSCGDDYADGKQLAAEQPVGPPTGGQATPAGQLSGEFLHLAGEHSGQR